MVVLAIGQRLRTSNLHFWMVTWWNTFAQSEIYFNSLVASGLLLNIEENYRGCDTCYSQQGLLRDSDKIFAWAERKRDASSVYRSRAEIFAEDFDLPLRNLLEDRSHRIGLRIMSLEYYISSLQSLRSGISSTRLHVESCSSRAVLTLRGLGSTLYAIRLRFAANQTHFSCAGSRFGPLDKIILDSDGSVPKGHAFFGALCFRCFV